MSINNRLPTPLFVMLACLFLSACASQFPDPQNSTFQINAKKGGAKQLGNKLEDVKNGKQLFLDTFNAHGGEYIAQLNDVNVGITGQWKKLITKIQPLVTDFNYRVDSQEKILPKEFVYASLYTGPGGNKKVVRTPSSIDVFYNQKASQDPEVLSSTALTADAFPTFLLGPLALHRWADDFVRIADKYEDGKQYYRIYLIRKPGFGFSETDEVVLWIEASTLKTAKIQITLEGHSTTKGAHVQVDYLDYIKIGNYTFPSVFDEKVNAPIAIGAHAWQLTGIDINRGINLDDIDGVSFVGVAKPMASPIQ